MEDIKKLLAAAAERFRQRLTAIGPIRAACVLLAVLVIAVAAAAISARHSRTAEARDEKAAEPQTVAAEAAEEEPESAAEVRSLRVPARTYGEVTARSIAVRDGFPRLNWDPDDFELNDGRMTYLDGSVKTRTGIDVSEHQGVIDWRAVAADGIDFAIIRVGYRGSTQGKLYEDDYFKENIKGAIAAGLPVGVYFYSQATTVAEAEEEADFVLKAIEGYDLAYPVVFDWEIVGGSDARTYTVSRRTLRDCAKAFCDKVSDAGYDPMIYFTQYLGYRKYMLRALTDYDFWYAEYESEPHFAFDLTMWQYSDTGTVAGIEGAADLNIYFVP